MTTIQTANLQPTDSNSFDTHQIYNGLDCCVTFEVWEKLSALPQPPVYDFARAMQAPALEMMLRGFKIDQPARWEAIALLQQDIQYAQETLDIMADAVWQQPLNPRSPKQLLAFFYDCLNIPKIWTRTKGESKLSMGRSTLEKIANYLYAKPLVTTITGLRDTSKQLSTLLTEVDPDGRMRTTYNICGTETGRWSSKKSVEGTGTNLQNISPKLRHVFIADDDWKICGIDGQQAESREVGWLCGVLFGDWSYLDACESGDLHTSVVKMVWPELFANSNLSDRQIADTLFYREFSRREVCKRVGHASNYEGRPPTISKETHVPQKLVHEFQDRYFLAFPCLRKYQRWCAQRLGIHRQITSLMGRTRQFFGHPNDDATIREAIAYAPQSAIGDYTNLALWRIWKHMPQVQLLAQLHDGIYFQYQEGANESTIIQRALSLFQTTRTHAGRTFTIPGEVKTGWNWANYSPTNPNGLKTWTGTDNRRRTNKYSFLQKEGVQ